MRRWLSLWGPPLLLMAIIFIFSSQSRLPSADNALLDRILKKGAHACGYGLLAVSYVRALTGMHLRRALPLALLFALLYSISDEIHQTFVPSRHGVASDVLIDFCGAIVGLLLWQRFQDWRQLNRSP